MGKIAQKSHDISGHSHVRMFKIPKFQKKWQIKAQFTFGIGPISKYIAGNLGFISWVVTEFCTGM